VEYAFFCVRMKGMFRQIHSLLFQSEQAGNNASRRLRGGCRTGRVFTVPIWGEMLVS
jgi:hypothetical protein